MSKIRLLNIGILQVISSTNMGIVKMSFRRPKEDLY